MMKSPVTSTAASEARNSTVVSLGFSSTSAFALSFALPSFLATIHPSNLVDQVLKRIELQPQITKLLNYPITKFVSSDQPQRTVPARDLKDMRNRISKMIQL